MESTFIGIMWPCYAALLVCESKHIYWRLSNLKSAQLYLNFEFEKRATVPEFRIWKARNCTWMSNLKSAQLYLNFEFEKRATVPKFRIWKASNCTLTKNTLLKPFFRLLQRSLRCGNSSVLCAYPLLVNCINVNYCNLHQKLSGLANICSPPCFVSQIYQSLSMWSFNQSVYLYTFINTV